MIRARLAALLFLVGLLCLAHARPGPDSNYNISAASGTSFSLTAGTNAGSATTGTATINYGTVTWGSGCNAVVVLDYWYNTATTNVVSSMTVGGSSAAQVAGVASHSPNNGGVSIDIWQLNSPSGSSGAISVTYSANVTFNSNVTPYCLVSAHTTATSASNTAGLGCSNVAPITGSVTVPASGAAAIMSSTDAGQVLTFTNATPDSVYTGGGAQMKWGHATASATVSSTPAAADNCTLGWAAYGP